MKQLILATLFIALSAQTQSLEPGLWKTKTSIALNGMALPSENEEGCVTANEAKDPQTTISESLKKEKCSLTKWELKNSKLDARIECQSDEIQAKGFLRGSVSKKNYLLKGEAEGTFANAIPTFAKLNLSGQWLKPCPLAKDHKVVQ